MFPLILGGAALQRMRENSVPSTSLRAGFPGLESFLPLFPALKRWAKLGRPSRAAFSCASFHQTVRERVLTHTLQRCDCYLMCRPALAAEGESPRTASSQRSETRQAASLREISCFLSEWPPSVSPSSKHRCRTAPRRAQSDRQWRPTRAPGRRQRLSAWNCASPEARCRMR